MESSRLVVRSRRMVCQVSSRSLMLSSSLLFSSRLLVISAFKAASSPGATRRMSEFVGCRQEVYNFITCWQNHPKTLLTLFSMYEKQSFKHYSTKRTRGEKITAADKSKESKTKCRGKHPGCLREWSLQLCVLVYSVKHILFLLSSLDFSRSLSSLRRSTSVLALVISRSSDATSDCSFWFSFSTSVLMAEKGKSTDFYTLCRKP